MPYGKSYRYRKAYRKYYKRSKTLRKSNIFTNRSAKSQSFQIAALNRKVNRVYRKTKPEYKIVGVTGAHSDFRDSHMSASEFINFIDYNKHYMNVKGGSVMNDYVLIIITSVQPIESIYANMPDEPRKQWIRRITNIVIEDNDDEIDIDAL